MAEYLSPGVYVEEFDSGVKAMEGVLTDGIYYAEVGAWTGAAVLLTLAYFVRMRKYPLADKKT